MRHAQALFSKNATAVSLALLIAVPMAFPPLLLAQFTAETQLTFNTAIDGEPVFSPDGSKLVFFSNRDGDAEIFVMNVDGSAQSRLTNNTALDFAPSFSPDGTKIVFYSNRDGDLEIFVMNVDGSGQTQLTFNTAQDAFPRFSPSGTKIAFHSDRDGDLEIFAMNADGSSQTQLTFNSGIDLAPGWSPDGSKITFDSNRDGDREIFIMNADGSGQTQLTSNLAGDYVPSFSPDGTKIVFASTRDGDSEVFLMNSNGSDQSQFTSNTASDEPSGWSPDGTRIAFSSNRDGDFEVFLGQLPLPDLIIESLTHHPENPTTADNIVFTAVVKNIGGTSAGPSTLNFRVGGETFGVNMAIPSLAPGQSHTVQRQLTLTVPQNYRNTVTADADNEVAEANEGNNVSTHDYRVTVAPFLVLSGSEVRVFTDTNVPPASQTEPSLAVNPAKEGPNYNIIVGYNESPSTAVTYFPPGGGAPINFRLGIGISFSTDGGLTWNRFIIPAGWRAVLNGNICCDTKVAFTSTGRAFLVAQTTQGQIFVVYSDPDINGDAGAAWSNPIIVDTNAGDDRPTIAIDNRVNRAVLSTPTENLYVVWQDGNIEYISRSTNTGAATPTFSARVCLEEDPTTGNAECPVNGFRNDMAIGPGGEVYAAYQDFTTTRNRVCRWDPAAAFPSFTCNSPTQLAYTAFPQNSNCNWGTRAIVPNTCIRTNSQPEITVDRDDDIYVAWVSYNTAAGHGDILLSRASGGNIASWTAPVTVNNDGLARDQFFPDIAVHPVTGRLVTVFYDRRDDPSNDLFNFYFSNSIDGGASIRQNGRITSASSNDAVLTPSALQFFGDYIDSDVAVFPGTGERYCAVWADLRDGVTAPANNDANIYFACLDGSNYVPLIRIWAAELVLRERIFELPQRSFSYTDEMLISGFNFTDPVDLSVQNIPTGVLVGLSQIAGVPPFTVTMTISSSGLAAGDYVFNINAIQRGTNISQTVNVPFKIASSPFILPNSIYADPGSRLSLTGKGFTPNTSLPVKLDGVEITRVATDAQGNIAVSVLLPESLADGSHTLLVGPDPNGNNASTIFSTSPPLPSDEQTQSPAVPYSPIMIVVTSLIVGATMTLSRRLRKL